MNRAYSCLITKANHLLVVYIIDIERWFNYLFELIIIPPAWVAPPPEVTGKGGGVGAY